MLVMFFAILFPRIFLGPDLGVLSILSQVPGELLNPLHFGGIAFLLGGLIFGGVLPIVSVEIWQRVYSAVSVKVARRVFLWSIAFILPAYFVAMLFGFSAVLQFPTLQNGDYAIYRLMTENLSSGLLGLGIAAILAVFLSTANSMALVLSASFAQDVLRREVSLAQSRLLTCLFGVIGAVAGLAVPSIVQLTLNAFYMLGLLFPPLVGGLFWRRATAGGANASLVFGFIITLSLLPFIPEQAFVPAAFVAIPVFYLVSRKTEHAPTERPELIEELYE